MKIIVVIVIGYLILNFIVGVYYVRFKNKRERKLKALSANRPISVLFAEAIIEPKYLDDYYVFRTCTSDEKARKLIVQNYLINNGLFGYRTEKIEL